MCRWNEWDWARGDRYQIAHKYQIAKDYNLEQLDKQVEDMRSSVRRTLQEWPLCPKTGEPVELVRNFSADRPLMVGLVWWCGCPKDEPEMVEWEEEDTVEVLLNGMVPLP